MKTKENRRKREENDECVHMFYVHFERLILSERYALCAELPPFVRETQTLNSTQISTQNSTLNSTQNSTLYT